MQHFREVLGYVAGERDGARCAVNHAVPGNTLYALDPALAADLCLQRPVIKIHLH